MKKRAARFGTSVAVGHSISVLGFQISKKSITPQKKAKLAMPASKRGKGGRMKRPLPSKGTASAAPEPRRLMRSEEHTSELQSLMRISYAVFCLKKKKQTHQYR